MVPSTVWLQYLAILLLCFAYNIESKLVHRTFETSDDFVFLGNFAFGKGKNGDPSGTLTFNPISISPSDIELKLVAYYDRLWEQVYHKKMNCTQKIDHAAESHGSKFIILKQEHELKYEFNENWPHYWFIAVANCNKQKFTLEYSASFVQHGGGWNHQFSYDEQGLLATYLVIGIVFFLGFATQLYSSYQLVRARSFHPIMRLLTISVSLEMLSFFSCTIHYSVYASNGVGSPFLKVLGELADMIATLIFMVLLILIAKGWGVTFPSISHIQDQKLQLIGIASVFLVLYIVLFFWSQFGLDPANTTFLYGTVPGIIYLIVRLFTLFYFLWCLWRTLHHEENKRRFYIIFGIAYSVWFLSLHFVSILAALLEDKHRIEMIKTVMSVYLIVTTLGYAFIGYLLWPTRAKEYFSVAVPDMMFGVGYDQL